MEEKMTSHMNFSSNVIKDKVNFIKIEEQQKVDVELATILTVVTTIILITGIMTQLKMFFILIKKQKDSSLGRLLLSSCLIYLICYPPVLLYYIFNQHVYPIYEFIGQFGCILIIHSLDVFVRLYNLFFPLCVVSMRFILIVKNHWAMAVGLKKITILCILASIILPLWMTLAMQFPIRDSIHGPYHHCMGRFEIYYNPFHHDTTTPGKFFFFKNNTTGKFFR